jgi:SAM-dependent methyltransferase
MHEERLAAVLGIVAATRARRVVDLGCGDGDLVLRLAGLPRVEEIVGIDTDAAALERLRRRLDSAAPIRASVDLRAASATDPAPGLGGADCAVLVETIEHLPPERLARLERAVFHGMRPVHAVVTTPNAEFNGLLGVPTHRFRHPDHRFEWTRAQFRRWAARVAEDAGYSVSMSDIAGAHPDVGGASQMAVFGPALAGPSGERVRSGAA